MILPIYATATQSVMYNTPNPPSSFANTSEAIPITDPAMHKALVKMIKNTPTLDADQ